MSQSPRVALSLVARLYARSQAARWALPIDRFHAALEASVGHAFAGQNPTPPDVDRDLVSLRLGDLALAAACAGDRSWTRLRADRRRRHYARARRARRSIR